jgi:hypothetical protein
MRLSLAFSFVIAVTTIALGQSPAVAQNLESVTDADAYAIYAMLVPELWATRSKDPVLLQRETESVAPCSSWSGQSSDSEWLAVAKSFKQENSRPKLLQPVLQIPGPYRLIPKSEIEADDARLALKYPGLYNRRPGSMEYAAVSAVGFNADKTKAMVVVQVRGQGAVRILERRENGWVPAYGVSGVGCIWIT